MELTPDGVCRDLCGNGRRVSSEERDDGNLYESDGCDRNCTIEPGYDCQGGSLTHSDVCIFLGGLAFESLEITDDYTLIAVLTHKVKFDSVSISDFTITST